MPALHSQELESCQECRVEVVVVRPGDTSWTIEVLLKVELPSVELHPQ
jgi:hypothetical protein